MRGKPFTRQTDDREQWEQWLSAYLDGQLSARERRQVEERLAVDPAFRAELEALRHTVDLVRDLPQVDVPRNFILSPAMMGQAEEEHRPTPQARLGAWVAPLLTAATATASLLLVAILSLDLMGVHPFGGAPLTLAPGDERATAPIQPEGEAPVEMLEVEEPPAEIAEASTPTPASKIEEQPTQGPLGTVEEEAAPEAPAEAPAPAPLQGEQTPTTEGVGAYGAEEAEEPAPPASDASPTAIAGGGQDGRADQSGEPPPAMATQTPPFTLAAPAPIAGEEEDPEGRGEEGMPPPAIERPEEDQAEQEIAPGEREEMPSRPSRWRTWEIALGAVSVVLAAASGWAWWVRRRRGSA